MKITKKIVALSTVSVIALTSVAQDYGLKEAWGIGIGAAVPMGYGANITKGFSEKLNVKIGFNTFKIDIPEELSTSGTTKGSVSLGRVYLGADYHPGGKAFSIGGGAMINNLNTSASFTTNSSLTVIDKNTNLPVTPSASDIGTTNATIEPTSKMAPYFSLGFGRALPKNFIGFRVEIGAVYQGELEAKFSESTITTGGQTVTFDPADVPEISSGIDEANRELAKWALLPFINFEITIKIK